ncbi:murein L,D-transpeptidase catalytic domain family protein [Flavitalea flava]
MKRLTITLTQIFLFLVVFIVPSAFVEAKTELNNTSSLNESASGAYHSVDAIKKIINYSISAASVCARTAEIEKESKAAAKKAEMRLIIATASGIYNEMGLEDAGLSKKAFQYAWTGYYKLQKKGLLHKTGILSICDFSQSSSQERMYVIDVRNRKLLYRTFVAHGINSGEEFANSFSNQFESCKSSLGFYITSRTYYGSNGLSLKIEGVDKGFNDHASRRNIVIHGAPYVSLRILHKYGVMGTTFGCPAIPTEMSSQIIPVVKNGSCFFIYYPSKKYLNQSGVLNG